MSGVVEFVKGSARLVLSGGRAYKAWVASLLALVAIGATAYAHQMHTGLIATNMRDQVSWAFYIGNFTFLVMTDREDLDDQQKTARALGITTDVLAGCAVIAGGVSLYFTIAGTGEGDEASDSDEESADIDLGVSPTGLQLVGTF